MCENRIYDRNQGCCNLATQGERAPGSAKPSTQGDRTAQFQKGQDGELASLAQRFLQITEEVRLSKLMSRIFST